MQSAHSWEVHYNRDCGIWSELPEPVNLQALHAFLDPVLERCTHYLLDPGAWVQHWPSRTRGYIMDEERRRALEAPIPGARPDRVASCRRRLRRFGRLLEHTDNPMASVLQRCREKNVYAGLSVRMNDVHIKGGDDHPLNTQFRMNHPEYRFGEHGCMNYALKPVRDEALAYLKELCESLQPDVLELDFLRRPPFFPPETGRAERFSAMNELVAGVHALMQSSGPALQTRVPPTVELCDQNGLDIASWCAGGWIRRIVPAPIYSMVFDIPLEPFRRIVGDRNIAVIPGMEKCVMTRGMPRRYLTRAMFRAAIAQYHARGTAGGVHFFNLFGLPNGTQSRASGLGDLQQPFHGMELDVLDDAGMPGRTRGCDQTYLVPPTAGSEDAGCALVSPLPAKLEPGRACAVRLFLADDFAESNTACTVLKLQCLDLAPEADEVVTVTVNGNAVEGSGRIETGKQPWMSQKVKSIEGYCDNRFYLAPRIVFDIPPAFWRPGGNVIEVVAGTGCKQTPTLFQAELEIAHHA